MKQKIYTGRGLKYLIVTFFTLILFTISNRTYFLYSPLFNLSYLYYLSFILIFIAMIAFFVGTFYLWKGRKEIAEKHINNVDKGLWLIIIFFAITTISGIFLDKTITNSLSMFILNLMLMLVSFYFLKDISKKKITIIWIAIFMFVIFNPLIPIVAHYFKYYYYVNLYITILEIFSLIIPYILFTFCYYKTYKTIIQKLKK